MAGSLELPLRGRRVLVTGASGLIGFPLCRELAKDNEVFAAARLRDPAEVDDLVAIGAVPVPFDLLSHDLGSLPDDIDVVVHLAARTPVREKRTPDDQRLSIDANALGTGRLMSRYRSASAFVFASTNSVYVPQDHPMVEDDPLGVEENFANGYALSKIIGESIVTFLSTEWNIPTTILRICQMYGPRGGAPVIRIDRVRRGEPIQVYGDAPNPATVLFEDDYVEKLIGAATIAAVPPVVTNFGGVTTTIQEYCSIAAELLDVEVEFVTSDLATRPASAARGVQRRVDPRGQRSSRSRRP